MLSGDSAWIGLKITLSWSDPHHGISPEAFPICTAWVRRLVPSLSNSRLECVFTVFSLTKIF
jgi:hypothetical protein